MKYKGSCHCGTVAFEVEGEIKGAMACSDALKTYSFNTQTAKHLFCSVCGIKSFHVPRSHPDGFSVNARCLDSETIEELTITPFDGREWEKQYPNGRGEYAK